MKLNSWTRLAIPAVLAACSLPLAAQPSITGLTPTAVPVNSQNFTLTVSGSNFCIASVVFFGSTSLPTQFVNANTVRASVSFNLLTVAGTVPITVSNNQSASACSVFGISNSANFTVAALLQIATSSLPDGAVGISYNSPVHATGGVSPFQWSATGMPPGLSIVQQTGQIVGSPTTSGVFQPQISVSDGSGQSASKTLQIRISGLAITGPASLTSAVVNNSYSATFTATGGQGGLSWSVIGTLPPGLSLSASTGVLSGVPTTVGAYGFIIRVTDSSGQVAQANYSLSVIQPPLQFLTTTLPSGSVGVFYSFQYQVTGGVSPYTFTTQTQLPAGLGLSTSGLLSGTPTQTANIPLTVQVVDGAGQTLSKTLTLVITSTAGPLTIQTVSLPQGTVNQGYTANLTATGGAPPYTWLVNGLPSGLLLNPTTGAITGTPTQSGNFPLSIRVQDSQTSVSASLTLTINAAASTLQINPATLPSGTVGLAYQFGFSATGGNPSYTWTGSGLPPGLSLGATNGLLTGTPTLAGSYSLTIQVNDSAGHSASQIFPLNISGATFSILTNSLPDATLGQFYPAQQLLASGGVGTITWSVVQTNLPPGLSLSSAGVISGTPTLAGIFPFTVQAFSSTGQTATAQLQIRVNTTTNPFTITTTSLPDGVLNQPYSSQQLFVSGAVGGVTWAIISSSTLPPGLSLSSAGVISGTPTQIGNFPFIVQATSSTNQTATASLQIRVNATAGTLTITTTSLPAGVLNQFYNQQLQATGGTGSYTWGSLSSLPPGLTLNTIGFVTGTPTQTGFFQFNVQVLTSTGQTAQAQVSLSITATGGTLTITNTFLPVGTVGAFYSAALVATGGATPYNWSSTGVPQGLLLDPNTGILSGSPTQTGTFGVTITVRDAVGTTASQTYSLQINITTALAITTPDPLAQASVGTAYSQIIAAAGGTAPYQFFIVGIPIPGLSMNQATGEISGIPTTAGNYNLTVSVTDSKLQSVSRNYLLIVNSPFVITTSTLPNGIVNVPYSSTIIVSGGTAPYTFILSGAVAPGLTISTTGVLSGIPTLAGTFTINVVVNDAAGLQTSKSLTVIINGAVLTISPSTIAAASANVAYSQQLMVTGGAPPYTWSPQTALPAGLNLDPASGLLSGTPTQAGTFVFTVGVRDSIGQQATANYSLVVNSQLRITTTSLPAGVTRTAYSATVAATGGTAPYNWSANGALPTGLTLSVTTGVISGTPTAAGDFPFTIQVTDAAGQTASQSLTISIAPGLSFTGSTTLAAGIVGSAYAGAVAATGGQAPYTYTLSAGSLPTGLSLNNDGSIRGTPSQSGRSDFTIQVADSAGRTATQQFSITIAPSLLLITSDGTLPAGTVGIAYSQTVRATGGRTPYTFSADPSTPLPAGLQIDSASGIISGTPTAAGDFQFGIKVTDSGQASVTKSFQLHIDLPSLPPVRLTGVGGSASPAQQVSPGIALASTFPVAVTGTITLTFTPASGPDDPAVQFSSGGRSQTFTIPAGSLTATLPAGFGFQTGTVAGTITIALRLTVAGNDVTPRPAPTQTITIDRAAPVIQDVTVTRTGTGLDITVTGFSTAREVSQAVLKFATASGANVPTVDFNVTLSPVFTAWYQSAQSAPFGSQFKLTIPVGITGTATQITGVTVTLNNTVGSSPSVSKTF